MINPGPKIAKDLLQKLGSFALFDILRRQMFSRRHIRRKRCSASRVFIEFVRHCGGEFSNGRVILASLIAAAILCPNEQLLNRLMKGWGKKDIASLFLPFLVAFFTWPIGFGREADKQMWLLLSRRCAERPVQNGAVLRRLEKATAEISK